MKQNRFLTVVAPLVAPLVALFAAAGLSSCSSAPRYTGEVTSLRILAESQLELGASAADRGNYEAAAIFLNESRRLAVITDDPSLLVRSALALGNLFFSEGDAEGAFEKWEAALAEALLIPCAELAAVSRIHAARGALLSGARSPQSVLEEVGREIPSVRSDQLYIAFSHLVMGLSQNALGLFDQAEASIQRSLAIHERGRHLELAAYDWFAIASIRSRSGNYAGALQALNSAVDLNRRSENSWGLAFDWRAKGDVQARAGNFSAARDAYLRSSAIFRALGHEDMAGATEELAQVL